MAILYIILNIAALVLLFIFIRNFIKKIKHSKDKPKQKKKLLQTLLLPAILLIVPFIIMEFISEPKLDTPQERIEFSGKFKHYLRQTHPYLELLQEEKSNPELNFQLVNTIKEHINKNRSRHSFDIKKVRNYHESGLITDYYLSNIKAGEGQFRDDSRIFLALHYTYLETYKKAQQQIDSVKNQSSTYYNFVKGTLLRSIKSKDHIDEAESRLRKSIADSVRAPECYQELARLYYYFHKKGKLAALGNDEQAKPHLQLFYKRISYMRSLNFFDYWESVFSKKAIALSFWGFISSLVILLVWLFYIRKIDVYELENWPHTLFTLFMSMLTIFLVYPLSDIIIDVLHYYPSSIPFYDFIYDVITIGMVEEFVKIIPVLIILRFTNAINEPFDFIYYCSVSAIGFAFVENIGYIQESSLYNINARALMACVAHIIFSSTIGYGMMLAKYKMKGGHISMFLIFFLLASTMHGFYDFWLMNDWAHQYKWMTTIYFIISVHMWHLFANNTMNISTFYDPDIEIRNDKLRYYLIVSLLGILMFSYVINGYMQGTKYAAGFLKSSSAVYGYFILYLSFSFSRFEVIRGYLAPFSIPFNLLIPRIKRTINLKGMPVRLMSSKTYRFIDGYDSIKNQLPMYGVLDRRLVVDNHLECYIVNLDLSINIDGCLNDRVAIMLRGKNQRLNESGTMLIRFFLIPSEDTLNKHIITEADLLFAGWALSRKETPNEFG